MKKRHPTPRLPFVRNSASHDFLLLAASRKRAGEVLTPEMVLHVMPGFGRRGRVLETVRHLLNHRMIEVVEGESWRITRAGELALYEMADRPVRTRDGGRPTRYKV